MTPVHEAFLDMATGCARMGSPFMQVLLTGLATAISPDTPVGATVLNWPRDPSGMADALPLRLAGGLHALVLRDKDLDLAQAYAQAGAGQPARDTPMPAETARALTKAALAAFHRHEAFLLDWLQSAPQTNEVRRSAALIAAGHWLAERIGLPLVLSELGSSAGLNLLWDDYALSIAGTVFGPPDPILTLSPDWSGLLPPTTRPVIKARAGVDLNPLDPVQDRLRLLAYLWPDQPDRLTRTSAALDLAARRKPDVARGDAVDWLEHRLATPHPAALHVVFHTVAWQYFPAETQARGLALLQAAGARATQDAPLAHLAMEGDDASPTNGAALTVRLWPGDTLHHLARVDFHGRWITWSAP